MNIIQETREKWIHAKRKLEETINNLEEPIKKLMEECKKKEEEIQPKLKLLKREISNLQEDEDNILLLKKCIDFINEKDGIIVEEDSYLDETLKLKNYSIEEFSKGRDDLEPWENYLLNDLPKCERIEVIIQIRLTNTNNIDFDTQDDEIEFNYNNPFIVSIEGNYEEFSKELIFQKEKLKQLEEEEPDRIEHDFDRTETMVAYAYYLLPYVVYKIIEN